jgi:hypothetical protein
VSPENVVYSVILLTICCPIALLVKYGSLRGVLFGARVGGKTGEVICTQTRWHTSKLVVYDLIGRPGKDLGIELKIVNAGGNSMMLTAMSSEEARRLVAILRSAISGNGDHAEPGG